MKTVLLLLCIAALLKYLDMGKILKNLISKSNHEESKIRARKREIEKHEWELSQEQAEQKNWKPSKIEI